MSAVSHHCVYCGSYHTGLCSRVKSIIYHEDGTVKHVELWPISAHFGLSPQSDKWCPCRTSGFPASGSTPEEEQK